jgi:MoaA/NifB/PqqE/SkfB family radical SAM enzyme
MFKLDPKKKFVLFKKKQHFCAAPWNLLYVYSDGIVRTCVAGREILGNLNHNTIEEIINSHTRKSIQQKILNDAVSFNCAKCVGMENQGNGTDDYHFLRNNYNELARDIDIDYYHPDEFVLGALDLHWSSLCDLKCITCWAQQSSSIAQEQGLPINHLPSERANMFIDWVVNHQHTLKEIYLSGGEPTMIKYNRKLLEQIQKRPDLQIRVNSNLMWDQDNAVIEEILKFPNVLFTCSADALGKQFEYIRRGGSWDKFLKNLRFLQQHKHVKIRINSVFFVMSAMSLVDTIKYFKNNFDVQDFTINQCDMDQVQLRSRNLSVLQKSKCRSSINAALIEFQDNLNLCGQLQNCLRELDHVQDHTYVNYLESIDQLAGTNWQTTFEELL